MVVYVGHVRVSLEKCIELGIKIVDPKPRSKWSSIRIPLIFYQKQKY